MRISFLEEGHRDTGGETIVEYVGGPLADRRETLRDVPDEIAAGDGLGVYRRSVRCADDGALRYLWHPKTT